jgi:phosphoribosyl 1,2-cyclic phosphodiesterase
MSITFQLLSSGSSGNVGLVSTELLPGEPFEVLVDAGLPWAQCQKRYPALRPKALLITHEHSDHIRYAREIAQKLTIPVFTTAGTARHPDLRGCEVRRIESTKIVHIGPLEVRPFAIPHDANEPVGFVFRSRGAALGWLTDLGEITPLVQEALSACDALVLEFNHDAELLWNGRYPYPVKKRVAGNEGHLSNQQAEALLQYIAAKNRLKTVVLAHLSESNNTPELALAAAKRAVGARSIFIHTANAKEAVGPFVAVGPATQMSLL